MPPIGELPHKLYHFYEEFLDTKYDSKHMNKYAKVPFRETTRDPRREVEFKDSLNKFLGVLKKEFREYHKD
jgi:hypothetical protein